ncbi:hypothetical protein ACFSJ3_03875 [Corallincola platygyrae]|uniref:NADH dehydrogenase subunit 6 n=1 Tax=Corallincola platygyrae TaxID=1193278 RepID=A0ABW4XK38_9GAMM
MLISLIAWAVLALVTFAFAWVCYKLNRFVGYAAGCVTTIAGFSPVVSYLVNTDNWFAPGGSGGVVGVAVILLVSSSLIGGSMAFGGYVLSRMAQNQV